MASTWVDQSENDGQNLWCAYKLPADDANASWSDWLPFGQGGRTPWPTATGPIVCGSPMAVTTSGFVASARAQWFAICGDRVVTAYAAINTGAQYVVPGTQIAWFPQGEYWSAIYQAGQRVRKPYTNPSPGSVAVVALGNGLLQVYVHSVFDSSLRGPGLITLTQPRPTGPGGADPWTFTQLEFDPQPPELLGRLVAGALPDRRIQLWGVDGNGSIWSTWQSTAGNANSGWESWTQFPAPFIAQASNGGNAVGTLPDGRLQLWAVAAANDDAFSGAAGQLFTCWKTTTDPNAPWTPWTPFLDGAFNTVAVTPLTNGALQLFAAVAGGGFASTWKASPDPDAIWGPWVSMTIPT